MNTSQLAAMFAFAVATAIAYCVLRYLDPHRRRVRGRISELERTEQSQDAIAVNLEADKPSHKTISELVLAWSPFKNRDKAHLQNRLLKAGIYHPSAASRLFALQYLCMIGPAFVLVFLALMDVLKIEIAVVLSCVLGCAFSILPSLWLSSVIAKHHLSLHKSLPDFLDLMIVCLEGGMSLQNTIRRVGDELSIVHPALALELRLVQRDMELGSAVDQALKRFAMRTDSEGVKTLSAFIREAQRFGTNITQALRTHADLLRAQREQTAEERAQKTSVKILLPTLLLIFPAIFVVLLAPAIIQIQEAFSGG